MRTWGSTYILRTASSSPVRSCFAHKYQKIISLYNNVIFRTAAVHCDHSFVRSAYYTAGGNIPHIYALLTGAVGSCYCYFAVLYGDRHMPRDTLGGVAAVLVHGYLHKLFAVTDDLGVRGRGQAAHKQRQGEDEQQRYYYGNIGCF